MTNPIDYIKAGLVVIGAVLAYRSATAIMRGDFEAGFTPGWIDFATSHPLVFALIAVIGAALIGRSFIAVLENA